MCEEICVVKRENQKMCTVSKPRCVYSLTFGIQPRVSSGCSCELDCGRRRNVRCGRNFGGRVETIGVASECVVPSWLGA